MTNFTAIFLLLAVTGSVFAGEPKHHYLVDASALTDGEFVCNDVAENGC
jgi:hypothetical protein